MTRWRDRIDGLMVRAHHLVLESDETLLGERVVLRSEGRGAVETVDHDDGWLIRLLSDGGAYYDVGSSTGFFALIATILHPDREVVAIDANPRALQVCALNLIANGRADKARFLLTFVGEESDGTWTPTAALTSRGFSADADATIPRRHLDGIVEATGVVPALVKIDVEGVEAEVLRGATKLARTHGPRFMVEMHRVPGLSMEANGELVLAWAREHDYDAWYLKAHELVSSATTFANRGRCHLLLQPTGTPYPVGLQDIPQGMSVADTHRRLSRTGSSHQSTGDDQLD